MKTRRLTVHDIMTIDREFEVIIGPSSASATLKNESFGIHKDGKAIGDIKSQGRFFGYDELRDAISNLLKAQ